MTNNLPATPKQLNFILTLARTRPYTSANTRQATEELVAYKLSKGLTRKDASALINFLQSPKTR